MGTSAPLESALVADIVQAQFPHLRPIRVTYLGEGYDSTACDVNGEWVFRFPKRAEVELFEAAWPFNSGAALGRCS